MKLQITSMASGTGSFEVENWKLDIVQSYFSGEKKLNSRPSCDRQRSDDALSPTSTVAADSPGKDSKDSEVTSLIKEPSGSVPVTPSIQTPKERLDGATFEDKGLGTSSREKPSSCTKEANFQKLSGIIALAGKGPALDPVIRPMKTESSVNPRIITPVDDTHKDETLAVRDKDHHRSNTKSIKPKITKNKCQFPISLKSLEGKYNDQGRNCVVVCFKSLTTDSAMERERTVLNNKKKVDKVLKKYKLKYDFFYSNQIRAAYNLCFVSPTETRKFVRDLNDITSSKSGPKVLLYFLCHEEMLGRLSL